MCSIGTNNNHFHVKICGDHLREKHQGSTKGDNKGQYNAITVAIRCDLNK